VREQARSISDIAAWRATTPVFLGAFLASDSGQIWRLLFPLPFSIALFVIGWNRSGPMIEALVASQADEGTS